MSNFYISGKIRVTHSPKKVTGFTHFNSGRDVEYNVSADGRP